MSNRVTRRGHEPTPRSRYCDGICAECCTTVGTENLVNVRNQWICVACGEAEIRKWNEAVKIGGTNNEEEK